MKAQERFGFSCIAPVAVVLGLVALLMRPPATVGAVIVTAAVGAIGIVGPLRPRQEAGVPTLLWLAVVVLGVAAFAIARILVSPLPANVTPFALGSNVLAAVAEEAFFRRLIYGWLAGWGPVVAIGGAAAAFAAVHVPAYGLVIIPVDLAAGLLFGWQRWLTGGWSAPAVSHTAANLLQMF